MKRLLQFLMVCLLIPFSGMTQVVTDQPPPQLREVGIEEHLGQTIPLDLQFIDSRGDTVALGKYFRQGKPVILSLVYYDCPMLCTFVLNGLTNSLQKLAWTPGKEFQVVTVSIDPRETPELAANKKYRYLRSLNKPGVPDSGWVFLVGEEDQIQKLADAVGFRYRYDEKQDMFAHTAAIFLLTETGKISRYLYGIEYNERDLRLGLLEASEGKIGSTLEQLILFCYHYDPESQSYVLFATNLMKLGGILTVIVLAIFLGAMWIKEKVR